MFTVPEILLFISVCLYILFHKKGEDHCVPFLIGEVVTVIAFVVAGIMYLNNIEECEVPHLSITSTKVICEKDNSSITGSVSVSAFYLQGYVLEECVYYIVCSKDTLKCSYLKYPLFFYVINSIFYCKNNKKSI